jgi:uncharacterized protein YacL (UPF0231 family)
MLGQWKQNWYNYNLQIIYYENWLEESIHVEIDKIKTIKKELNKVKRNIRKRKCWIGCNNGRPQN